MLSLLFSFLLPIGVGVFDIETTDHPAGSLLRTFGDIIQASTGGLPRGQSLWVCWKRFEEAIPVVWKTTIQ
jgi:hypothetical protein